MSSKAITKAILSYAERNDIPPIQQLSNKLSTAHRAAVQNVLIEIAQGAANQNGSLRRSLAAIWQPSSQFERFSTIMPTIISYLDDKDKANMATTNSLFWNTSRLYLQRY